MVTTVIETAPSPVAGVTRSGMARLALLWPRIGLGLILVLSAALEFVGLADEGYANTYYSSGIKSMLTSWHNFFFVSSDAGGFVSIDKPPLGLWIEAASAKLFGFSGFSMLLPEALAGVLSVALLYKLVARSWGPAAGLVAALVLAVTPISVVIDRNNTMDSQLILVLLLGAWAATLAAERGRLGMLLLCALFVGLGFNIKMLQAYLVLPAFGAMYLFGAPIAVRKRIAHLLLATVVLLIVSLCWATIVDLTPAGQRPFVSDSGTNSELSLALGYNGLGRFTQALFPGVSILHILGMNIDLTIVPAFAADIGNPGFFRLLSPILGTQVSWLLPLALIGLVVAACRVRFRLPLDHQGQSLLLWGGWLFVTGFFFSTARFYHLYYLVMFAPAVAALAGIAVATLWRLYYQRSERGHWLAELAAWLLPAALLVTAGVQISFLNDYPDWSVWLNPLVAGACIVAAAVLIAGRLRLAVQITPEWSLRVTRPIALAAAVVGLVALLSAPTAWAGISLANDNASAWLPQAGPANSPGGGFGGGRANGGFFRGGGNAPAGGQIPGTTTGQGTGGTGGAGGTSGPGTGSTNSATGPGNGGGFGGGAFRGGGFGGGGGGGAITFAGSQLQPLDARLLQYLEANQGKDRFLAATMTSSYASLFILDTNQPAMALGGYQGWDRIVTPKQLAQLVANGTVRFFYISSAGSGQSFGGRGIGNGSSGSLSSAQATKLADTNNDLSAWVQASCSAVPTSKWQTTSTGTGFSGRGTGGLQLYDCASAVKH
jgi:4-amino-4-deoxy-L-arabinose transferase-like glycosyltransferase